MGLFTQPYRVTGQLSEAGAPVEMTYHSTSPDNARQAAERDGMIVLQVTRLKSDAGDEDTGVNMISFESPETHAERLGEDGPPAEDYAPEADEHITVAAIVRQQAKHVEASRRRQSGLAYVLSAAAAVLALGVAGHALWGWVNRPDAPVEPDVMLVRYGDVAPSPAPVNDLSDYGHDLRLDAVIVGRSPGAVLNGEMVPKFSTIDGFRLVHVDDDWVIVLKGKRAFRLSMRDH
ncbi:MAG: hypothetical protein AAF288_11600 [Planctomycetota bacterium]